MTHITARYLPCFGWERIHATTGEWVPMSIWLALRLLHARRLHIAY